MAGWPKHPTVRKQNPKLKPLRKDIARIQECTNSVCCFHEQVFIEYKDEPVWSHLICAFCGRHQVCNLIVPDNIRADFCRKRDFDSGKKELANFDIELRERNGWFSGSK